MNISDLRHLQPARKIAELGFFVLSLSALVLAVVMVFLLDHESGWLYPLG
jgi:hypothetical protein